MRRKVPGPHRPAHQAAAEARRLVHRAVIETRRRAHRAGQEAGQMKSASGDKPWRLETAPGTFLRAGRFSIRWDPVMNCPGLAFRFSRVVRRETVAP